MKGDAKSKTLAVATSKGTVYIFKVDSLNSTWQILNQVDTTVEIPVTSIDLLLRGENLYAAGYANG